MWADPATDSVARCDIELVLKPLGIHLEEAEVDAMLQRTQGITPPQRVPFEVVKRLLVSLAADAAAASMRPAWEMA